MVVKRQPLPAMPVQPPRDVRGTYAYSAVDRNSILAPDALLSDKITGYPNPVEHKVLISVNGALSIGSDVVLLDMLGRIHNPKSIRKISSNSMELDMSGLTSGVYLVKMKIDNTFKIYRIVKL